MNPISVHGVVLAGGHGSRMPPLVSPDRPKAKLTVANRPMLFYSLYALCRARITNVTVIVDPQSLDVVSEYIETEFHQDPLIIALNKANNNNKPAVVDHVDDKLNLKMNIRIHSRADSAETADALRELDIREHDVFILSSDTIMQCALDIILQTHRRSHSACTVAVTQVSSDYQQQQQQQTSSKSSKSSGKSSSSSSATSKTSGATGGKAYTPQLYALINDEQRLLAMLHPTDLQASTADIRQTLIRRYDHLSFVSDVQDPHVYCFHSGALRHVLAHCPAISSVKYDLIPYVARRQHTLWRVGDRASWALPPTDDFIVTMHRLPLSTYSARTNTVASFRSANIDLAAGQLSSWLTVTDSSSSKSAQQQQQQSNKKEKKKQKPPNPFSSAGERVSVTPDCIVAAGCSAGDRTSVKKSVIGKNCVLGSNVKLNGCVLLSNVTVKDGANLTATVVCDNAVIGPSCMLKECRVAANTTVDDETEATETGFGGEEENTAVDLADELGGGIEFF